MNFITDTQFSSLRSSLKNALLLNKKAAAAIEANDLKACLKVDQKVKWLMNDSTFREHMFDISKEVSKTLIDGPGSRSTASYAANDNLWTIGTFGSVFVDIIVSGKNFRVHLMNETNYEVKKGVYVFYVEGGE